MTEARLELLLVKGGEAEVVEEVFAHLEVGELRSGYQQQYRFQRAVALAERPTDAERALGVVFGAYHRPAPAVCRLRLGRDRRVGDGLPRMTGEVERLGEKRRGRVRKDEERVGRHQRVPKYRSSSHGVTCSL
jgi:hypothetical protein